MILFAVLLLVPALIALASFTLTHRVTWKEFGVQMAVQTVVAGTAAGLVSYENTADTEIWNGVVASKNSEHVSCSHSYPCNCREVCSGSGKNLSCSMHCDTCYEHAYDVSWRVHTSNKEEITISRVDSQGLLEPPRFSAVKIGEPTAVAHDYVSYVKAAPDSLLRHQGLAERYAGRLPPYPGEPYDYYRLNRLVLVGGASVSDATEWNEALSGLDARWGSKQQANVIVVLAKNLPQDYFYALEQHWIGGKKNDIVLVIGVDDGLVAQWATVMCWTKNEMFKVKLRDDIMARMESGPSPLTWGNVMGAIEANMPLFERKPMADFQYLEASITPSPLEWGLTLAISLLTAFGLSWWFIKVDVFGDEEGSHEY
jgi:hypothetical protein